MICKNCGKENGDGSQICSRCGRMLYETRRTDGFVVSADFDSTPVQPETGGDGGFEIRYVTCRKCNAKNPEYNLNCRLCGCQLQKPAKGKKSAKKIILSIFSIVAVASVAVCITMFYVIPRRQIKNEILDKTFDASEKNTFLNVVREYVDIDVKSYTSGEIVVLTVTSPDINVQLQDSYGYISDSVIEELLQNSTASKKEVTLYFDEDGEIILTYDYYNAAYCGMVESYYKMISGISGELIN